MVNSDKCLKIQRQRNHKPSKPALLSKTTTHPTKGETMPETFDFSEALRRLKDGAKLCRTGWNGKGMWIVLMPALSLPPYNSQEPGAKVNDRTAKHIGKDTPLNSQPYIVMWTAQQTWQPGWLASQNDLLAEDWMIA